MLHLSPTTISSHHLSPLPQSSLLFVLHFSSLSFPLLSLLSWHYMGEGVRSNCTNLHHWISRSLSPAYYYSCMAKTNYDLCKWHHMLCNLFELDQWPFCYIIHQVFSHERSLLHTIFLLQVGGALLARLLETATIPAYFAKPKWVRLGGYQLDSAHRLLMRHCCYVSFEVYCAELTNIVAMVLL